MSDSTILICDDNKTIHQTLTLYLEAAGYSVLSAYDGLQALEMIKGNEISLLVLDIMLPGINGIEVCRTIRKSSDLPIIFLSAMGDESDRIVGLELGADDYVTKPFSPKELVTRIKTVLRRAPGNSPSSTDGENYVLSLGKLSVNTKAYTVAIKDRAVKMTPKEVELTACLIKHAGSVVSREDILNEVWGADYFGDLRAVDTLIARIRSKIPEKASGITFRSIYGVGYLVEETSK